MRGSFAVIAVRPVGANARPARPAAWPPHSTSLRDPSFVACLKESAGIGEADLECGGHATALADGEVAETEIRASAFERYVVASLPVGANARPARAAAWPPHSTSLRDPSSL